MISAQDSSVPNPSRPRRGWGCCLRLAVATAAFLGFAAIADYLLLPRISSTPAPGQPQIGDRDPRPALLTAADLPAGFQPNPANSGLIVNARKASELPRPEEVLDRLTLWGRLSGDRASFQQPAANGQPRGSVIAEASVFRDHAGALAYLRDQEARAAGSARRFDPRLGDASIGWQPGEAAGLAATRLAAVRGTYLIELSLSGSKSIAGPDEATRLARVMVGRVPGS